MKKKNTYYFQHDSNAREDEKIIALRMDKGAAGYGIYWLLLELLSTSPDCEFERNYNKVGFVLHESAKDVKEVVEKYGLFQYTDDGKCFYSRRMTEQMDFVNESRQKNSDNGKKGGNPNFKSGKTNPYYSNKDNQKDNPSVISEDNQKDNPSVISEDNKNGNFGYLQDKHSIVKKSKEENSKENISFSSNEENVSDGNPPDDATETDNEEVGKENIDYRHIVEYWNTVTGGIHGRLETIENNRRKMTRARILEHGKEKFKEAIDKSVASDFLRVSAWFNFDWLIKPNNFDKVITGNYCNKNGNDINSADIDGKTKKHVTKPTGDGITADF